MPRSFLTALCAFAFLNSVCAQTNLLRPQIVGGIDAPANYPWIVSLQTANAPANFDGHNCGGSLIDPYWVLTATHCIVLPPPDPSDTPESLRVLIGTNDLDNGGRRFEIAEIINHPDYFADEDNNLFFDLSLIRLAEPVDDIAPVTMATTAAQQPVGATVRALGWGALDNANTSFPNLLQQVDLEIFSNTEAATNFGPQVAPFRYLPAGARVNGRDACQGDSGGPLVIGSGTNWRLLGVTSYGGDCGVADEPGIYTRVSEYQTWISDTISDKGGSYLFDNATASSGGWYSSPWLGWINRNAAPWIYHADLGWLWAANDSYASGRSVGTRGVWLWDSAASRWIYTNSAAWPNAYHADTARWFRYSVSASAVWIHDYSTGQWIFLR